MSSALEEVDIFISEGPFARRLFSELDAEQRRSLGPDPCVPMPFERLIVHEGGVTSVLPCFVVLFNLLEVAVRVHVIREDEDTCLGGVPEVGRSRRRELADVHRGLGEGRNGGRTCINLEGDCVKVDYLVLVRAFDNGVRQGARVEPEGFATVS